jgi:hypothetical protein
LSEKEALYRNYHFYLASIAQRTPARSVEPRETLGGANLRYNPFDMTGRYHPNKFPLTILLGLFIILWAEFFLFTDVHLTRRTAVHTETQANAILAMPRDGLIGAIAREVSVNMTAIAWIGYLILTEGVVARQSPGSPVRRRPHHFATLCLASVFIWCVFDVINFHTGMRAWVYIGMPVRMEDKFLPYFFAFASIVPGMLMSGQVMLNGGWFNWARSRNWKMSRWIKAVACLIGLLMFIWPLIYHNPITNLTLWTSLVFLLDPINDHFGRPSMFRDLQNGWYGRTLAAFAGGLLCGFLWEFWNYWALTKWTYNLPFLGRWGRLHYFEMPLPGLIGFIPFGLECWVMWQTIRMCLDGLAEPLPSEKDLL